MNKNGEWSLAPAYDITYAYNPTNYWLKEHQMLINGKSKDITYDDLLAAGKNMRISKAKCNNIINNVTSALSCWDKYADAAKINNTFKDFIGQNLSKNLVHYKNY